MNKPDWFKDVNEDWVPHLVQLWEYGKVRCKGSFEATSLKDIVHHYSHQEVSIEIIDNDYHVIFVGNIKEESQR
jgi:hypothetical protein